MRVGKRALCKVILSALAALAASGRTRGSDTQGSPLIGIIDFYGLRLVLEAQVRQALELKEGDSLPSEEQAHLKAEEARHRLQELPGVAQARISFICCDADKLIVYVGIEEKGSPSLHFATAPGRKVRLPADVVEAGQAFDKAFSEAIDQRDFAEDDSRGYTLFHDPALRSVQERFVKLASQHLRELRNVLHNSADSSQRALAAQVIAYAANRQAVVPDLVAAMNDPDGEVRNNATRALWVMAEYSQQHPALHLVIPTRPFLRLLNSIEWTDRNKSSLALAELTQTRDPAVLSELRRHALPSLAEMARWKSPGHAHASFVILGRLAGLPEKEIEKAWDSNREAVISAALKTAPAK